ncbi:GNAT family N-acetyltransferase [Natrialba taiwanensis]|uniref:GCN5-like N-acetyltransferase n=1 Tax=Natrialba taiwanensis DSM 12281 TaxID=1230458 RepID=L9ZGW3_9EURY|nr:GNAT family N-acetyltransferase [Natrialba taiwanensis]ELY85301.1 GCN5-like N-acetyltransferase [Natrialba taiwanensis DSM 12281]
MTETRVHELETEEEWVAAFPVLNQLRTHLDEESYLDYLREMTAEGYRFFAVSVDDEIVSLAGVGVQVNMYYGRHVWVYELVTDADHRSAGHGSKLLSFVEDWAEVNNCELVALSSGLQREDAHRFYEERAGMERASYVYKQPLK